MSMYVHVERVGGGGGSGAGLLERGWAEKGG